MGLKLQLKKMVTAEDLFLETRCNYWLVTSTHPLAYDDGHWHPVSRYFCCFAFLLTIIGR